MNLRITSLLNLPSLQRLAAAVAVCWFSAMVIGQAAPAERPNIIFILTDDHRADTLGCYGNSILKTPHIDRLAQDGTLFERAFVTSAICTPSRVCFFLGQFERRHGVNFNSGTGVSESAWAKSYPILLRQAGYFTGYVGKNHVPIGAKGYASGMIEQSFDYWYGGNGHLQFYPKKAHRIFNNAKADTQVEILQEGALNFLSPNEDFLAGAAEFLKRRPVDQPFCLSIAFNLPHAAGTGSMKLLPEDPELYRTAYRDQLGSLPLPPTYVAKDAITSPRLPADVLRAEFRQGSYNYVDTPEDLRERLVRVLQTVTGIDALVGQLRKQLAAQNLAERTVIILSSDHGIMHGEFGLGGKALNYEPCLRVPLIIHDPRAPKSARGQRRTELALSVDVAPTILSLAGVKLPDTVQGRDLTPLVQGRRPEWREAVFAENLWSTYFGNPRIESVRTAEWKYIRYFANERTPFAGQVGRAQYGITEELAALYARWLTASIEGEAPVHEELFHLAADPDETRNLAKESRHREKLEELRRWAAKLVVEAKGPPGPPDTVRLDLRGPVR